MLGFNESVSMKFQGALPTAVPVNPIPRDCGSKPAMTKNTTTIKTLFYKYKSIERSIVMPHLMRHPVSFWPTAKSMSSKHTIAKMVIYFSVINRSLKFNWDSSGSDSLKKSKGLPLRLMSPYPIADFISYKIA